MFLIFFWNGEKRIKTSSTLYKKWFCQLIALFILAGLGFMVSHGSRLQNDLTPEGIHQWAEALSWKGPFVLVLFGLLAPQALIPRWPLAFVCGLLYGIAAGALIATTASLGGAVIQFYFSGSLLAGMTERLRQKSDLLKRIPLEGPGAFWSLFLLRAFPFSSFVATNLAAGSVGMKAAVFVPASFLGMLPSSVMYASWGKLMKKPEPEFYALAVFLVLLFTGFVWLAQKIFLPKLLSRTVD